MEFPYYVEEVQIDMDLQQYKIIHLPKEQWTNVSIPMRYTTEQYYDVKIQKNNAGFHIELIKEKLMEPISHYPEEYDFPDKLYQEQKCDLRWAISLEKTRWTRMILLFGKRFVIQRHICKMVT